MVKQSYTDKITQRSIHTYTLTEEKKENIYISIYKNKNGREQPNQ